MFQYPVPHNDLKVSFHSPPTSFPEVASFPPVKESSRNIKQLQAISSQSINETCKDQAHKQNIDEAVTSVIRSHCCTPATCKAQHADKLPNGHISGPSFRRTGIYMDLQENFYWRMSVWPRICRNYSLLMSCSTQTDFLYFLRVRKLDILWRSFLSCWLSFMILDPEQQPMVGVCASGASCHILAICAPHDSFATMMNINTSFPFGSTGWIES